MAAAQTPCSSFVVCCKAAARLLQKVQEMSEFAEWVCDSPAAVVCLPLL